MPHDWKLTSVPSFFYDPEFNPRGENMPRGYDKKAGQLGWKCASCGFWAPKQFSFSNPPHETAQVEVSSRYAPMTCEEATLFRVHET